MLKLARAAALSMAIATGLISGGTALAATPAQGNQVLNAKIFDPKSNKQKLLFTYKSESVTNGDVRTVTNTFTDSEGKVAAVETTEFVKAGEQESVRSYKMSQKQLQAEGAVEIKDGVATFSYARDGKTKTSTEKVGEDFIVGPSLIHFLQRNWAKIQKGETVKGRFAVLDRTETIGFQYFKDKETEIDGQKAFDIKMKPSSFVIAALVDPLHFFMSPDGTKLFEIHGRTQVKQKDGSKWKDLDAVTVYER